MSTYALKPWTDVVRLHPDVENDALSEAMFAIDLGAIATNDPGTPAFYRDAKIFFQATHITSDLGRLLEEVLGALAGGPESAHYNRVLKLRTHFGGGKSHTMAALLHAARDRASLTGIPEAAKLASPKGVKVAVFDGEKVGALEPNPTPDGLSIRTMWGWIAWQLDQYSLMEQNDREQTAPGGMLIARMLEAAGTPKLILMDEVLKYMERAAAVRLEDSTLQRQSMEFLQSLTTEVAKSQNSAMVYSLQWSAREAFGNVALLEQIDKLTSRVDQLREPVTGDEVLAVLKKRLLASKPPEQAAEEVSRAFAEEFKKMRIAVADTPLGQAAAEEQAAEYQDRLKQAYPFHPALIDVMKDRWASVEQYQRTRGALRFLATCLHQIKKNGGARSVLGPGDVPMADPEVRRAMLKDLAPQQEYEPAIAADIVGPNAKAKKIDDRYAKEDPKYASVRPATRVATAILTCSFGGLRRDASDGSADTLPPGVTENDLLTMVVSPDLDRVTATSVLAELKTSCLYLHFDGVRYCFKKDANVVKMIEDAEQEVARDQDAVTQRIREMLEARTAGRNSAIVWPEESGRLDDKEPVFLIGYMPLEFAALTKTNQEARAKEYLFKCGTTKRVFRNGVAIAVPEKKQIEPLRRAVRYIMAVERVELRKGPLKLQKEQLDQLRERKKTEEGAAESAMRSLYTQVWLGKMANGAETIEAVEKGNRPLQATAVHEQMMELLTAMGKKWLHASVTPQKLIERVRLGDATTGEPVRAGIKASEIVEAFFSFLDPPRIESDAVVRKAIVRGVSESAFGFYSGAAPTLGADGRWQVVASKVSFARTMMDDEVDLETGWVFAANSLPVEAPVPAGVAPGTAPTQPGQSSTPTPGTSGAPVTTPPRPTAQTAVSIRFSATRDQVFKTFNAIANLAEKADGGKVSIQVEATKADGFEPAWLRNAVDEPLDEANLGDLRRQ